MGAPLTTGALPVYSDPRWPALTGIGNVLTAMKTHAPGDVHVHDLSIEGGVGSPMSPYAISKALRQARVKEGVFWSAGFVPPLRTRLPSVVTVHDLTHLHFYSRRHRLYYATVFRPLYRRCDEIVCVSDYTRREFLDWSGIAPERVSVVYNGVSPAFAANDARYPCDFAYVLYPGNHRRYKNLHRLLAAYAASALPAAGVCLAMTGDPNPELTALAERLGVGSSLRFFGRVPDAALPSLYRGALAVAFVSLYEGFGLPIVEAMASRVPVLTANVSAMPEVAGDAALIVDPYSEAEIAEGLNRLHASAALRDDLVARGFEQARRFDWASAADQLWGIVKRAAGHA